MSSFPKKLLPCFWYFISPYKGYVGLLFLSGLVWGIQNTVSPYLLKLIIDRMAVYSGDKANIFEVVQYPALGYVALWFMMAVNFRMVDWVHLRMFPALRQNVIMEMFSYLNRHSHAFLQNNFAGSLSNKIMDMSSSMTSLLKKADEASANICAFFIALLSMALIHPIFAGILSAWALSFIGITLLFSRRTKHLSMVFSESKSTLSGKIVDSVTNLTTMKLFARNTYENARLREVVNDTVEKDRAVQSYILKMRLTWDVTFILLIAGMLGSLIAMYAKSKITIGDIAFIMTLALNIFMHMWHLASQFVQCAEELGKCAQALNIITAPHDIVDAQEAVALSVSQGAITFDHVTFRYQRNQHLFSKKYVEIAAGSKVGLVGFSGSGKTTFVNLILRFFDVESGRILIDGHDIAKVTQHSLHAQISMIPQDPGLFHRSLMDNIRYGKLEATDEEVIAASIRAHCHEFIEELPEGYASLVGERGVKLSGGQRQRLAIARAILKNAPILILDEATSALDSVTEKHIQEGLKTLMEGKTTLVIAHRLSTLSSMDRILVFDKGQIIEDGTHAHLLSKNGHYARLWKMQAGGFLPEKEGHTA